MKLKFSCLVPFVAFMLAAFVFPSGAAASSIAGACQPGTLLTYEHTQQCMIGVLIFQNFGLTYPGAPSPDSDADIFLTPSVNGFTFTQTNGQPFSVNKGQIASYRISYQFVIDPAPVLEGAELGLDPPFGDVTVTQAYCNDSAFLNPQTCTNGPAQILRVHNPDQLTARVTFNPPANQFGNVQTTITLDGTLAPAGFDSTTGTAVVVGAPATPEPSTVGLAIASFALLAGFRRHAKRVPLPPK